MKMTDAVIKDLIILYQAGEASKDTITLVEAYLNEKPELAEWMKEQVVLDETPELPADSHMKSFRKLQRKWRLRVAATAIVLTAILTWISTFADLS